MHRVFKARYFADRPFKEAMLGRRPSYTWRSIMAAKDVAVSGSRWVVGNGEQIDIWKDRWLPTPDSFKVVSPCIPVESNKVSWLLDRESRSWDVDKVRSSFLPHEAETRLGISISPRFLNNSVIWAWSTDGRFSVKSAYKVAQKCLKERSHKVDAGGASDNSRMRTLWKLIWNLKCPNKIEQFMWRACKNILPTKQQLRARGINIEDHYDLCGMSESSGHTLWGCKLAAEVWGDSRLKLPAVLNQPQEFLEIIWEVREGKPDTDWDLFAVTAGSIWNHRNAVRHGGSTMMQVESLKK